MQGRSRSPSYSTRTSSRSAQLSTQGAVAVQRHLLLASRTGDGKAACCSGALFTQIVSELVEEDGLVIIGAGLGLQRLLAVMLRLHYHTQVRSAASRALCNQAIGTWDMAVARGSLQCVRVWVVCAPQEGVLLVLGMPSWQRESVAQELRRHDSAATPPVEITNEV